MAATPDRVLLEVIVEKLQVNDGPLSKATRRLISCCELTVESLGRILDDINRYNKFIKVAGVLGISCLFLGCVLTVLGIKALFEYGLCDGEAFLSIYGITFGPFFMAFGACFARHISSELNNWVMKIVENQVVPLVKKLNHLNNKLQIQLRGVCTSTANQTTWLSYFNSLDTSTTVITNVKSLIDIQCSICESLKDRNHPAAEHIINHLLPWLQQHIKELKNVEQKLNKITTLISDVVNDNTSS